MIETIELSPGITLRCCRDTRFKQGALSVQLLRPMTAAEAAPNALLPAILLRGTARYRDLRAITARLDDLYGASVGTLVRRIGDYQTTGLYCGFMEDRFALAGDRILEPMVDFLRQLLFDPLMEDGGFCRSFVESEKRNLISTIEAERNDKRAYAAGKLLKNMCAEDSFGIPRLGEIPQVAAIDHVSLYKHYQTILEESPIALFYVGSREAQELATLLAPVFSPIRRCFRPLPAQTGYRVSRSSHETEQLDVSQGKLCLGFYTPITNRHKDHAAMQVLNTVFGAGMTSKLFMQIREKQSACYAIGSGYYGSKGIMTVSAGIDSHMEAIVREEILRQLEECRLGHITTEELTAAKEAMLSGLRTVHDSPGAIEGYYSTAAISGLNRSLEDYRAAIEAVTVEDAAQAARTVQLHSSFFLKGVGA